MSSRVTVTKPQSNGGAYPFWYGTIVDKLITALAIAFWWAVTIPLIIWAFVRTIILYLLLAAMLVVPAVLTLTFGLALFTVTLYWTPAVSIALTTFAPLIAGLLDIAVFALSIAWFILIVLVDLWNILIPLFVVIFIYVMHFLLTVITEVIGALAGFSVSRARGIGGKDLSSGITDLFTALIEVAFFFADIIVVVLTTVIGVLPGALTLTITIARPLLLLFFQTVVFIFQALQFVLLTLFQLLPSVFFSVLKLVRVFSSLLRSVPVAGPDGDAAPASESPRYQAGMDAFFNTLVKHASDKDWDRALTSMDDIARAQETMTDYSHLPDPLDTSNNRRHRTVGGKPRGSLHARWRGNASDTMHAQRERMFHDDELYSRGEHAHIMGSAVLEGFHTLLDTSPPLHTHHEMMQRTLGRLATTFTEHPTAHDWLRNYNTRYGHPALWLADVVPDLHGSRLGRWICESNPDHPANVGRTHHQWRRDGYPPLNDHPNAERAHVEMERHAVAAAHYTRMLAQRTHQDQVQSPDTGLPAGEVPLPFEIPVLLGSDCFRSDPKFILCLPRPANRRFTAPEILIPTNLGDPGTCPGFVVPPTPGDGFYEVLIAMLNPITAIRNTWTYFRYLLSLFSNVLYRINEESISNPLLAWLFDLLALNDINDGEPLTTEQVICLFIYAWYPFYGAAVTIFVIGTSIPLLWLAFSLLVYLALPFYMTWRLVRNLLAYYRANPTRIRVLDGADESDVARQKWQRELDVLLEQRNAGDRPPGTQANDLPAQYERLRSRPFTETLVSGDLNNMSTADNCMLLAADASAHKMSSKYQTELDEVQTVVLALYRMGALSPAVRSREERRRHMAWFAREHPLVSHVNTLAHSRDLLTNMEVALGHRPLDEAVPLTGWK